MPRVRVYYSDENDPLDFCSTCWMDYDLYNANLSNWASMWFEMTGSTYPGDIKDVEPENPGGLDHPPYDDCDYVCENCGTPLTDKDELT